MNKLRIRKQNPVLELKARSKEITRKMMRMSVLSLVKVPPGTKLYATVHTENRISQSQVKMVTNINLQGEHFEACQNMIGQIDVAKPANKTPAKVDINNNSVV